MIRVNVIYGKNPVLLVVPHGPDDTNTAIIGEKTAKICNANAVINQGFYRADIVDPDNDMADCNRVDHAVSNIIFDEFLKPIIKIKDKFLNNSTLTVFHIHGAGDLVHKEVGEHVDVIIGYGLGKESHSFTCKKWRRNAFIGSWMKQTKSYDGIFGGGKGGKYSGRSSNNLNQFFRKHDIEPDVQSMQLEFPFSERNTEIKAEETAIKLAGAIQNYINMTETEELRNIDLPKKFI